jgi:cell wall assembly regulator SMI1
MDPIEQIERARRANLVDEDGHRVVLTVAPPATAADIAKLEDERGFELPRELHTLLAHTQGLDGILDQVDFTGRSLDVELADMFPSGLPIAHDGYGNFWVADLTPHERETARVFFACHDAPVVLYQAASVGISSTRPSSSSPRRTPRSSTTSTRTACTTSTARTPASSAMPTR